MTCTNCGTPITEREGVGWTHDLGWTERGGCAAPEPAYQLGDVVEVALAVGGWTCECGQTTLRDTRESGSGPMQVTVVIECPHCKSMAEVLPLPKEA